MNRTPAHPRHPSYIKHRSQVLWQILLPMVLAFLFFAGAIFLLVRGTFSAGGDVGRWAAISTMWLTLPVMLAALITLVLLIAVTWLIGRLIGLIPPYTYIVQKYASEMEAGAKKVEYMGHRPMTIFPELGRLIRLGFNKIRRG